MVHRRLQIRGAINSATGDEQPQVPPLRSPGFPVETRGFADLHAALFKESRTRGRGQQREVGNPSTLRSG
jgi:hypothetical protein